MSPLWRQAQENNPITLKRVQSASNADNIKTVSHTVTYMMDAGKVGQKGGRMEWNVEDKGDVGFKAMGYECVCAWLSALSLHCTVMGTCPGSTQSLATDPANGYGRMDGYFQFGLPLTELLWVWTAAHHHGRICLGRS
ncbi:hypothetical protein AMECASPLE_021141 [Ameca splendens]|uniref:Uncharacterized protein n=1 Tax=Ameca splendens TaxID=208324 RepID=A0ABV1A246_9TELE